MTFWILCFLLILQLDDEELKETLDTLTMQNSSLTAKLIDLSEECLILNEENKSIKVHLIQPDLFHFIHQLIADYLDDKST